MRKTVPAVLVRALCFILPAVAAGPVVAAAAGTDLPTWAAHLTVSTSATADPGSRPLTSNRTDLKLWFEYENAWLLSRALVPVGIRLAAGRGAPALSLGDPAGNLFLTSSAPPYPFAYYRLTIPLSLARTAAGSSLTPTATYTRLWGDLTQAPDERRWLGVHYLQVRLLPHLTLGAGEAVLFDTRFTGDIAYTVVPLLPYYLAKKIPGLPSNHDNSLFFLDASGRFTGSNTTFYASFLVNEFPMHPGAGNPALYAWQAKLQQQLSSGVGRPDREEAGRLFTAEYTQVRHLAYSNGNRALVYGYQGLPLGYPRGSDLDRFELGLTLDEGFLGDTIRIEQLQLFVQRQGEGKLDDWPQNWDEWRQRPFLTGTVETWAGAGLRLGGELTSRRQPASEDRWPQVSPGNGPARMVSSEWHMTVSAGPVWNLEHRQGEQGFRIEATASWSWSL